MDIVDRALWRNTAQEHYHCDLVMETSSEHNHCGLYCVQHRYWFKWITPQERRAYQQAGIPLR